MKLLNDLIRMQKFAASRDETRPQLSGLLIEKIDDDTFKAVATDGHILLIREFKLDRMFNTTIIDDLDKKIIRFHSTNIVRPTDSRPLEHLYDTVNREYPNYKAIIPKASGNVNNTPNAFGLDPALLFNLSKAIGPTSELRKPLFFKFEGVKHGAPIKLQLNDKKLNDTVTAIIMPVNWSTK